MIILGHHRGVKLNRFLKKSPYYNVLISFSSQHILETHRMMRKSRTRLFIYFLSIISFPNNSGRVCPLKLKIGMPYHMNNTFQNIVFLVICQCALDISLYV